MTLRCEACGFGYRGRRVGDACGDRSDLNRLRALAEHRRVTLIGAWPEACPGRLVRRSEYRLYRRRQTVTEFGCAL